MCIRDRCGDDRGEAETVARTLRGLVDDGACAPGDVCILYRTNAQSRPLEEQLRRFRFEPKVVGATAFYTRVNVSDYGLDSFGALVGIHDRVELSVSRQAFDTRSVGAALGLGQGFTIRQDTFGVKVRVAGDAVLEQDRWMPQIAVGVQHKRNDQGGLLAAIGAKADRRKEASRLSCPSRANW